MTAPTATTVILRTGETASLVDVEKVIRAIRQLMAAPGGDIGALYDVVELARDPQHRMQVGADAVLEQTGLLVGGVLSAETAAIIRAAMTEDFQLVQAVKA